MKPIAPISALAAVLIASSGVAAESAAPLRYVFRTGETWREEATLTIEMLDASGSVLSRRESTWVDRVEVASVSTQGSALLFRTPDDENSDGERLEVVISDRGAYALSRDPDRPDRGMLASAIAARAPVLPDGPLARGSSRTRRLSMQWEGPTVDIEETTTFARLDEADGRMRAVLEMRRAARPVERALAVDALSASAHDTLIASASDATIVVDVAGLTGAGELEFDVGAGRLLSYRMEETLGLAVRFGAVTLQRTSRITFALRRLPGRAD